MKTIYIVLIIIGAFLLLGPIMLGFAKLNKVDPYILEKSNEEINEDPKSYILVGILYPLFVPLWLETWLVRLLKKKK